MRKEAKSASQLEAMIMQKAALRADCAEVMAVAVRGGQMGWRVVTITRDGRMTSIVAIDEIADELRAKYDLHSDD
jgi:hypothetical protein